MKFEIKDNLSILKEISCNLICGNLSDNVNPVFSVVIPTYKRPTLLKETIMSAVNQKDFTLPYEIIVVDNDDTDMANSTETLIKELNISNLYYYKNAKNIGGCGNWNRCVMLARSNWVVMCHDDDLMGEDCLSVLHKILLSHNRDKKPVGYIRPSGESFYEGNLQSSPVKKNSKWKPSKPQTALMEFTKNNVIWSGGATWAGAPTCGALINKAAFIDVGGYNEELSPCPDCYVPYHMLGKYGVYKTCYSLGKYRWGENDTYRKSTLIGLIKAYNEFLTVLAKRYAIVKFFENECFVDCARYYQNKGLEAQTIVTKEEIEEIRKFKCSKLKLKMLLLVRKLVHAYQYFIAK